MIDNGHMGNTVPSGQTDRQTDTHYRKHYLATTSLAGEENYTGRCHEVSRIFTCSLLEETAYTVISYVLILISLLKEHMRKSMHQCEGRRQLFTEDTYQFTNLIKK